MEDKCLRGMVLSLNKKWKCVNCSSTKNLDGHHKRPGKVYLSEYRHCKKLRFRAEQIKKVKKEFQKKLELRCRSCHQKLHKDFVKMNKSVSFIILQLSWTGYSKNKEVRFIVCRDQHVSHFPSFCCSRREQNNTPVARSRSAPAMLLRLTLGFLLLNCMDQPTILPYFCCPSHFLLSQYGEIEVGWLFLSFLRHISTICFLSLICVCR